MNQQKENPFPIIPQPLLNSQMEFGKILSKYQKYLKENAAEYRMRHFEATALPESDRRRMSLGPTTYRQVPFHFPAWSESLPTKLPNTPSGFSGPKAVIPYCLPVWIRTTFLGIRLSRIFSRPSTFALLPSSARRINRSGILPNSGYTFIRSFVASKHPQMILTLFLK